MSDAINPNHYKRGGLEAIDVIEAFSLNFRLGNAAKYILRAGHKGDRLEDLRKAQWYLAREIAKAEAEAAAPIPTLGQLARSIGIDPSVDAVKRVVRRTVPR